MIFFISKRRIADVRRIFSDVLVSGFDANNWRPTYFPERQNSRTCCNQSHLPRPNIYFNHQGKGTPRLQKMWTTHPSNFIYIPRMSYFWHIFPKYNHRYANLYWFGKRIVPAKCHLNVREPQTLIFRHIRRPQGQDTRDQWNENCRCNRPGTFLAVFRYIYLDILKPTSYTTKFK